MNDTAPKWIELPPPLHWREVAAGEPERSRHPTSQTLGPEMPDWTEDPKARAWDEPPPPYDWRNPPPYQGNESSPELPMNGLYGSEGKGKISDRRLRSCTGVRFSAVRPTSLRRTRAAI